MLASADGGAMSPAIVDAGLDELMASKLKPSKLKAGVGTGEGDRPKPALERVGTMYCPFGVVKYRVGSWSWSIGVALRSFLALELLSSVMKRGVGGQTSRIGEEKHEGGFSQLSCGGSSSKWTANRPHNLSNVSIR